MTPRYWRWPSASGYRVRRAGRYREGLLPQTLLAVRTLVLLLFLAPFVAQAQTAAGGGAAVGRVDRHTEFRHYDVQGTSVEELTRSLLAHGPSAQGERFYGLTEWTLNAEYTWVERDTGCTIEDLVVRVLTVTTMPRWEPPRNTPPEFVQAWTRFIRALDGHEAEHRRLAEQAAEAIRWELATLRLPNCGAAEPRAQAMVAAIVEDYNERNRRYDARTHHGVTEGAVWPPRRRVGADVGQR